MRHLTQQSLRDRRVSLHNYNGIIRGIMQGALAVASGKGLRSQSSGGQVRISLSDRAQDTRPFEPRVSNRTGRKVRVAEGVCYVYGVAFQVAETEVTLDIGDERVWVMFPITPGSGDAATIEHGDAADVSAIDRNTHAFRVLAHVETGDTDAISTFDVRWFGGDVYFDD